MRSVFSRMTVALVGGTLITATLGLSGVAAYAVTGDPDSYPAPAEAPTLVSPKEGGTVALSINADGDPGWLLTFDAPPNDHTGVFGSWTCAGHECANPQEYLDRENSYFDCFAAHLRNVDPATYDDYVAAFDAPEAKKCRDDRPGSGILFDFENNSVFLPASRYQPGQTNLWIAYWSQGPITDVVEFAQPLTSAEGDQVSEYRFADLQAGPPLNFTVGLLDKDGNLPSSGPPFWVWIIVAVVLVAAAAVGVVLIRRRQRRGPPAEA